MSDPSDIYTEESEGFRAGACYSCNDDAEEISETDPDAAVEAYLDHLSSNACDCKMRDGTITHVCGKTLLEQLPATLKVTAYKRMEIPDPDDIGRHALACVIEWLDEERADPNGDFETIPDWTEAPPELRLACIAFGHAIREHYRSWACEPCGSATVNVEAWVRANAPEWLELDAALRSPEPAA